jgi:dihydroorotase
MPRLATPPEHDRAFELVVKGGEVVDPSQGLHGPRDIGIRYGKIAAVEENIAGERAIAVIDAFGKVVTPGLIDVHAHVYPYGSGIGLPPDELVAHQCTTTVVSPGDAGANNIAGLRRFIAGHSRTRVYAFVHIANMGLAGYPVSELPIIDYARVDACAKAIAENPDFVLGAKVRMSEGLIGALGMEPLTRAIKACDLSGRPASVMVHIGGVESVELMDQILDALRPGDFVTHCFTGARSSAGVATNLMRDGRIIPSAIAARQRGVIFDIGHGGGSFDYTVAEAARDQGFPPDVLSTDIHAVSGNKPGKPYLTWVMSKFLNMGYTLGDVVAMATNRPGRAVGRDPKLGTLQVGAPADIAILERLEGPVRFVDTRNNWRDGSVVLQPHQTITGGVPFGRPYAQPFSVS